MMAVRHLVGGVLIGILGVAAVQAADAAGAQAPSKLLRLTASASLEPVQDRVELTLAVQQEGQDAAALQRALEQVLGKALERARPEAVPGQVEVSTGTFQVHPRYDNEGRIRAWSGRAELLLSGGELARLSSLAARLPGLQLSQVKWSLSPGLREATLDQVQAQAVQLFRAKAQALAQQFGFRDYLLGEVQVSDGEPVPAVPALMARSAMAADASSVPLAAGRGKVSVTVSGSVQLRP
jgi:predicted secreted protein